MQESQLGQRNDVVDLYLIILLHDGRILCTRSLHQYNTAAAWHTSMYKPNISCANILSFINAHVKAQFSYAITMEDNLSFISTYADTTNIETLVYKLTLSKTARFKVTSAREIKAMYMTDLFVEYAKNRRTFLEVGIDIINLADSTGELYE